MFPGFKKKTAINGLYRPENGMQEWPKQAEKMFQRRNPRPRLKKLREALWPSMGLKRLSAYYKHRMGRLPGTPYYIAAGFATGAAVSFTPFVGGHIALGFALCWMLRASFIAMVLGTLLGGNPWTFPLIWIGTYKLGNMMLGRTPEAADTGSALSRPDFTLSHLLEKPLDLLLPMTVGSLPLAALAWVVSFLATCQIIREYKEARRQRLHNFRNREKN
jgi:uncharacterized protein